MERGTDKEKQEDPWETRVLLSLLSTSMKARGQKIQQRLSARGVICWPPRLHLCSQDTISQSGAVLDMNCFVGMWRIVSSVNVTADNKHSPHTPKEC